MVSPRSIVVLDCGGQYAHLIASRIRRMGFRSDIRDASTAASLLQGAAGIIVSGGPQSVYEKGSPQPDPRIFDLHIPVLGICYGQQWVAHTLGGTVQRGATKEYGRTTVTVQNGGGLLLSGATPHFTAWMSHGDEVVALPKGFQSIASTNDCAVAAMADEERSIYCVQFHIEVAHTEGGNEILKRFVMLCDAAEWSMRGYSDRISGQIEEEAKGKNVFMLVSGGVDSTVAFTLLNRVLGPERVRGLLVDTGLMRKNEVNAITEALCDLGINNLHTEDASDLFFQRLTGITDPEEKRAVIGATFLDVQASVEQSMALDGTWLLGQGTIYPDTIETGGTAHSDRIKTHHNRVPVIQKMIDEGRVIEPLKDLYKDEVRMLGEELGLPSPLVWRHPFPGPGLGVRILCRGDDSMPCHDAGKDIDLPHAVLPIRSVGVQGDGRTYRQAIVLFDEGRIPSSIHWDHATRIPNTHPAFNRVLFCLSQASPSSFHSHSSFVTRARADLLRACDAIVHEELCNNDLYDEIWQFPVVLLPVGITPQGESIVLRPVHSEDAMTASAVDLPPSLLASMTQRIMALDAIDAVFLDLTSKPPGTIEWE